MNENIYKKKFDFQQKLISKKSKEIECLNIENFNLKQKISEQNEIINSMEPMRNEMAESIEKHKALMCQYKDLINELKQMKKIFDKEVFKGKWWLIKLLLK